MNNPAALLFSFWLCIPFYGHDIFENLPADPTRFPLAIWPYVLVSNMFVGDCPCENITPRSHLRLTPLMRANELFECECYDPLNEGY